MSSLFQDEPGEPEPFGDEPDEADADDEGGTSHLFQDEVDEADSIFFKIDETAPPSSTKGGYVSESVCFQDELDEPSHSDSESCLADIDETEGDLRQERIVALSFSTMNTFMASQLRKTPATVVPRPPRKRRCYDNSNRAAKAAAAKQVRGHPKTERIARNDPVPRFLFELLQCSSWHVL